MAGLQKTFIVLGQPTGPTGTMKGVNILGAFTGASGGHQFGLLATGATGPHGTFEMVYNSGPDGVGATGLHKTLILPGYGVTATKTDDAEDATAQTTYTWAAKAFAIGAAAATRLVVAAISSRVGSQGLTLNSVTIGGVVATKITDGINTSGVAETITSLWQALVPTGTTATVSAVFSAPMLRAGCIVYTVLGSNGVKPSGASVANFTGVSVGAVATGSITIPPGGAAIIAGMLSAGTAVTITPTNYTTDLGATAVGTSTMSSGKDSTPGVRNYTMTWGGTTPSAPSAVFAAWTPAAA